MLQPTFLPPKLFLKKFPSPHLIRKSEKLITHLKIESKKKEKGEKLLWAHILKGWSRGLGSSVPCQVSFCFIPQAVTEGSFPSYSLHLCFLTSLHLTSPHLTLAHSHRKLYAPSIHPFTVSISIHGNKQKLFLALAARTAHASKGAEGHWHLGPTSAPGPHVVSWPPPVPVARAVTGKLLRGQTI